MLLAFLRGFALGIALGALLLVLLGAGRWPSWVDACVAQWGTTPARATLRTPRRRAHFLAQVGHESRGCTRREEDLAYTTTARLQAVWPSRFKTDAQAAPYVRSPERLANLVYGGRLGNVQPGDGWRFRGRGPLMLTGRQNYRAMATATGLPLEDHPDLVAAPSTGWLVASAWWRAHGCNAAADRDDVAAVTRCVSGSLIGLEDRKRRLRAARRGSPLRPAVEAEGAPHGDAPS